LTIMYHSSLVFDSVIIVESLSDNDLKTGIDLFETTVAPATIHDPGFLAEFYQVGTVAELLAVLAHIEALARNHDRRPIIQFEMHGSKSGLALKNGERLAWAEIAPSLAKINRVTRVNLLVVAALCHGWHMIDILRPTDRAPAYGIIGTPEVIKSGSLLLAMQRFYDSVLQPPHDLLAALKSANTGLRSDTELRMINAELMLGRIYSHYVEAHTKGEGLETRVNDLVAALAPSAGLDVRATMELRQQVRSQLNDHAQWFAHYRNRFLWLDEFPENKQRFQLTYHNCRSLARG
jgi:hypothetical protein